MMRRVLRWWRRGPGRGDVLGINRRNLDFVFADYRPGRFRQLDDKLATKRVMEDAGVAVPRTLGVVASPADLPVLLDLLGTCDALVLKPANGWGGKGILVLRRRNGTWSRAGGEPLTPAAVAEHAREILTGVFSLDEEADTVIVEELIEPHPFYVEVGPAGLSDLRIVLENGQPLQAMCRVPTAASDGKANLHGGGVGLGIDLASGVVTGALVGDRRVAEHPDTGLTLTGLQLPAWDACLALAVAAAATVDVRYLGVDIVVDRDRGPLLLELNARPGLAIQQANATGQPVSPPAPRPRLDRFTGIFNAVLLMALVAGPFGYHWWQGRYDEVLVIDAGDERATSGLVAAGGGDDDEAAVTGEFDASEEIALATASNLFAQARAAVATGDTSAAGVLYRAAIADSSLAPFALNNMALLARAAGRDSLALVHLDAALAHYPNYQRALYNKGLVLMDLERADAAREALNGALALQPNHASSWAALGSLEFRADRFDAAVTALEKAVRYDPTTASARLKLGLAHRLRGDLPAARQAFAELVALEPGSEPGRYWLARSLRDLHFAQGGAAGAADSLLEKASRILDAAGNATHRVRALGATLALERGDPATAADIFTALADERYQRDRHRLALGLARLELGDWAAARSAARAARRADPAAAARIALLADLALALADEGEVPAVSPEADPVVRLVAADLGDDRAATGALLAASDWNGPGDRSWARWLVGRHDPADSTHAGRTAAALAAHGRTGASLEQRLAPGPGLPPSYILHLGHVAALRAGDMRLVRIYAGAQRATQPDFVPLLRSDFAMAFATGDMGAALEAGARLQGAGYAAPDFHLDLAAANLAEGRSRTAERLLGRLPQAFRATPDAVVIAARLARGTEATELARRELLKLLERAPDHVEARYALGQLRSATGDDRGAVSDLRSALDQSPGRSDIRADLARVLMQLGRYDEAAGQWTALLAIAADNPSALFNRALCRQRAGDEAGALADYDAALALRPAFRAAAFNRGLALERLGRLTEARLAYARVLEIDPDHEPSRRKLAALQGEQ